MCVRGRLLGSLLQGICGIGTSCLVYVDVAEAVWHMLICVVPFCLRKLTGRRGCGSSCRVYVDVIVVLLVAAQLVFCFFCLKHEYAGTVQLQIIKNASPKHRLWRTYSLDYLNTAGGTKAFCSTARGLTACGLKACSNGRGKFQKRSVRNGVTKQTTWCF